jgi:hypothetical protein
MFLLLHWTAVYIKNVIICIIMIISMPQMHICTEDELVSTTVGHSPLDPVTGVPTLDLLPEADGDIRPPGLQ